MTKSLFLGALAATAVVALAGAQAGSRPLSPRGDASTHVLGTYVKGQNPAWALGRGSYQGGKWIDISYGRPLKRGRDLWGAGATYGKDALVGAPIWRAGADVTTRLKTEVPLAINGKTVAPGDYSLFVDLKANAWTFVVSSWDAQQTYDPNNKAALWGAYNYTPDKDVVRAPMTLQTLPHSFEELSWDFVDMTDAGGAIALMWDKNLATVPFRIAAK
jgi:hypothetical protein